jgi:putative transposase
MGKQNRRNLDANFKTKVVLATLKGEKTLSELCAEFSVHSTQISAWKKQALANFPRLFGQASPALDEASTEALTAPLYQQIGQLKVEVDFLKKKLKQAV